MTSQLKCNNRSPDAGARVRQLIPLKWVEFRGLCAEAA